MTMKGVHIQYSTMKNANNQFNAVSIFKTPQINNTIRTFFQGN